MYMKHEVYYERTFQGDKTICDKFYRDDLEKDEENTDSCI